MILLRLSVSAGHGRQTSTLPHSQSAISAIHTFQSVQASPLRRSFEQCGAICTNPAERVPRSYLKQTRMVTAFYPANRYSFTVGSLSGSAPATKERRIRS